MDRPPRKRVRREGTFGKFDNTQWPDGSNETIATLARARDEARERNDNLSEELRTVLIELAEVREFAKRLSEELNGEDDS